MTSAIKLNGSNGDEFETTKAFDQWRIKLTVAPDVDDETSFVFEATLSDDDGDTHAFVVINLDSHTIFELMRFLATRMAIAPRI